MLFKWKEPLDRFALKFFDSPNKMEGFQEARDAY
jgi:hypothetical protein